ncbi:hypothetical protein DDQ68_01025 [Hymenobacter nivis]|uniref:Uncharacterized protein n=1 Tax=Hymenobacter nivis TaxID=1850093 RepID=A0A2Z3GI15_9BACT|nr:hypothetical protein DDQ68_01025 [Hymenobacter nivis]
MSIGLVLGFFFILKDNAKAGSYLRRDETAPDADNFLHLRLPEHVSFLNKASIVYCSRSGIRKRSRERGLPPPVLERFSRLSFNDGRGQAPHPTS